MSSNSKSPMDVIVKQDESDVTATTIATYGLSGCYFILVDGYYADQPVAFLMHHSTWIEPKSKIPGKFLAWFLKAFTKKMNERRAVFSSKNDFLIENFSNMQLLVGGSRTVDSDPIKNAFSLLLEPNTMRDKIKSLLNDQEKDFMDLLINHTTIMTGFTYLATNEEEDRAELGDTSVIWPPIGWLEYDCVSKTGKMAVEWESLFGNIVLAKTNIDLSRKEQQQNFYWEINTKDIDLMAKRISQNDYALGALGRAFSALPNVSIYTPPLKNSSQLTSDSSTVLLHHHQLQSYNCLPKNVIHLTFVRSKNDIGNFNSKFTPSYTDLLFGKNKIIFGYKNLNIDIYCLSSSLNFFFEIIYDKKINQKKYPQLKADDIVKSLNQCMPSTTNLDLFLSKLNTENEYSPFGEQLFSYRLKGEVSSSFIYRINENYFLNSKFVEWYSRLETFLVFFRNTVSTINKEDPNWVIYLLYQQYQNNNGQICYAPIGFSTVYLHYAYRDKKRPRISQVLILPPYQRKGHGRRLLTAIYNDLRKDSRVQDITIKDPSDEFVALHDLVSLELCHKYLPDLFSKESILKTGRLTKEMIDKGRDICKLTKEQIRRVYEIYFLRFINQNDEEQMKHFRLTIKQRLFHSLKVDQQNSLQLSDPEKRKKYLADQYQCALEHYQNILRTFNKYHSNSFFISNILLK